MSDDSNDRIESEARARIFWGEAPESVLDYLKSQGFVDTEAQALVNSLRQERADSVRSTGRTNIIVGTLLILIPLGFYFIIRNIIFEQHLVKLFGVTVFFGLIGGWKVFRGTIMFLRPHSEGGDLSEVSDE